MSRPSLHSTRAAMGCDAALQHSNNIQIIIGSVCKTCQMDKRHRLADRLNLSLSVSSHTFNPSYHSYLSYPSHHNECHHRASIQTETLQTKAWCEANKDFVAHTRNENVFRFTQCSLFGLMPDDGIHYDAKD